MFGLADSSKNLSEKHICSESLAEGCAPTWNGAFQAITAEEISFLLKNSSPLQRGLELQAGNNLCRLRRTFLCLHRNMKSIRNVEVVKTIPDHRQCMGNCA